MTETVLYLLALTLVAVVVMAIGIFWAIRSGQFDDLEGPAHRILMDDDDPMIPGGKLTRDREISEGKDYNRGKLD